MTKQEFENTIKHNCALIDSALQSLYQDEDMGQMDLMESMRYSLLTGGKRIRPILTIEFCKFCGGTETDAIHFATAIEMVHTYSLIHDDLPCMDDDDYRRGKLTNHKVFGDATALLAGDSLLTGAFEELTKSNLAADQIVRATAVLASLAGVYGMTGGQMMDLNSEGHAVNEGYLTEIHQRKTGDMIVAASLLGVIAANGAPEYSKSAEEYARSVGLAFQIRDDVLDVIGDEKLIGRSIGSDARNGKITFATLYGIQSCEDRIQRMTESAIQSIAAYPKHDFLTMFATYLSARNR